MPVHVICGPMFSGKTTKLIQILKQRNIHEVYAVKHIQDTRYPENSERSKIISHDGDDFPCYRSNNLFIPAEIYEKVSIIAIDEGQFFTDLVITAEKFACEGKEVIITGLRNGLFMEPITSMVNLLGIADVITTLSTTCVSCLNAEAAFTYRKIPLPENEEIINPTFFLEGNEAYCSLCRRCHIKKLQFDKKERRGMFSNNAFKRMKIPSHIFDLNNSIVGKRCVTKLFINNF